MSPGGSALRELWHEPRFPALLATRLTSQTADGIFQASLASAVFFNPEHHAGAAQVANGFVILLLPYSLVGPFVGVFLDRWRRQRVLLFGALVRAVIAAIAAGMLVWRGPTSLGFEVAALAALSVNRFYLADLSAAMPSVVSTKRLVLANSLSPTAGTVVTIIGGGIGLGIRSLVGSTDHGNAFVVLVAAFGYLLASAVSARLPAGVLGPQERDTSPLLAQLRTVIAGFVAGARHVRQRPAASHALAVICGQRLLFGIWSIQALLLYRNDFHSDGVLRSGIVGFGQAVGAGGVGFVIAAAVTPWLTARIGKPAWIVAATVFVATSELVLGTPFAIGAMLASALAMGFATQATKICVDTIVQAEVDDEFRGRVFSFYDTIYNISFVAAALVAALTLPTSGRSLTALVAMSAGYLAVAAAYQTAERRRMNRSVVEPSVAEQGV